MKLFAREYGDGPSLILLHGLLASHENWHTVATTLSDKFHVIVPDLRNHGRSFHSDDFSYSLLAADVLELIEDRNLKNPILVGHSMGGKAAMEIALEFPEVPRAIVMEDILPGETEPISGAYLRMMIGLDLESVTYRRDAEEMLFEKIKERRLVLFLLKNLLRNSDGTYGWKADLEALNANYKKLWQGLDGGRSWDGPSLFIRGGKSDVVADERFEEIFGFFPRAKIVTIPDAGHWVHGDAPDEFSAHLKHFFKSLA